MLPFCPAHLLFFAILGVCCFALGLWLAFFRQGTPVAWLTELQGPLFEPMAAGQLTLQGLREQAPEGALWVRREEGRVVLSYGGRLAAAEASLDLLGELQLEDHERASLAQASGADASPQRLAGTVVQAMSARRLADVVLTPAEPVPIRDLVASLGEPRMRYALGQGEGWFYPQRGMTLMVRDGTLDWLRVTPRAALGEVREGEAPTAAPARLPPATEHR
ncbi:hypothetical protein DN820_15175 [Stutzerimonas nosocomialis]|uniref:Uncharacterized protein n=1 Tax=Stutzerimonas nosocomialis TaxID=1056496 RepID=A0A5R9QBY8_9GAMM|nr:hypothetical protein [Stutzerimonas nosocomialis]TLX62611.1 hypothetical protein DN820_15175 [Stutzerimonas nosocomialis]